VGDSQGKQRGEGGRGKGGEKDKCGQQNVEKLQSNGLTRNSVFGISKTSAPAEGEEKKGKEVFGVLYH